MVTIGFSVEEAGRCVLVFHDETTGRTRLMTEQEATQVFERIALICKGTLEDTNPIKHPNTIQ